MQSVWCSIRTTATKCTSRGTQFQCICKQERQPKITRRRNLCALFKHVQFPRVASEGISEGSSLQRWTKSGATNHEVRALTSSRWAASELTKTCQDKTRGGCLFFKHFRRRCLGPPILDGDWQKQGFVLGLAGKSWMGFKHAAYCIVWCLMCFKELTNLADRLSLVCSCFDFSNKSNKS